MKNTQNISPWLEGTNIRDEAQSEVDYKIEHPPMTITNVIDALNATIYSHNKLATKIYSMRYVEPKEVEQLRSACLFTSLLLLGLFAVKMTLLERKVARMQKFFVDSRSARALQEGSDEKCSE